MSTALLARFPLGTYQAHRANGQPDPFPDVARLFSALVASAGTGSTARQVGDRLRPSDDAVHALKWFEANPPTQLSLPERERPQQSVTSYRAEGVFDRRNGPARVVGKRVGDVVALARPIAWIWDVDIPEDVRASLDSLCADVAYLGESDSPVVLEFGEAVATHRLDPDAGPFAARGAPVRVPVAGRLDELERAHQIAHPARRPTSASDRHSFSEVPTPPPVAASSQVVERRYVAVDAEPVLAPWTTGWLLPVGSRIPAEEVVAWSVTLHRAFAARIADPAPTVITGRFGRGERRPANRLAIHYLDGSLAGLLTDPDLLGDAGAFVVSFPRDGFTEDRASVEGALIGLTRLYRADGRLQLRPARKVDTARLWRPASPGLVRLWTAVTPLVPETRPQPGRGRASTLADAAKLSVAFVARDDLPQVPGRGDDRCRALVEAVESRGVRVSRVHRVTDPHVERYAHKLPESLVAQPFRAILDFGTLWSPRALVAVGQSRHLGGGLLAPLDVPDAVATSLIGSA